MIGKLVTTKPVRTVRGDYRAYETFVDYAGDWLDTVHFPQTLKRFPPQGGGFYQLYGEVVEEFGVLSLEVQSMKKVGIKKL